MAKFAAIQMASGPNIYANLMEAGRLIEQAAIEGADLVVLPETFAIMGEEEADTVAVAEDEGSGLIQSFIKQQAIKNRIWIVAGTIPIKSTDPTKAYAASLMYNDRGLQVARYDKMHLFDVEICEDEDTYTESQTIAPGTQRIVVDTPFGKIGMAVCYDLRFPGHFRDLMAAGAEIFLVPSAFTETTGKAHWNPLLRARAIENLCYVIAPAQGGYHINGRTTYGHSLMVDYWGNVKQELVKGSGIVTMEIELIKQRATRKAFPVLDHRLGGCPRRSK
ncbi:MAG TPA: carbon-nitrogen hydrolase family protein [Thiothrix sp.]|nr:carbon-nitrogen hydrolase family protein [Thiothrix sp.]